MVSLSFSDRVNERMSGISIFLIERFITHRQKNNAFNQTNQCRYECPAKENIENPLTNFAEVEFVDAQSTEQNGKEGGGQLAFPVWGDTVEAS